MSKIVLLGPPAHGHVNPTLPVVRELVGRGEQVIYYNTEEFRPQIEQAGAVFHAYPATALSSTEISAQLQDGNLSNVTALLLRVTETLLPFVLDELRREAPDLIMFVSIAVWGKMASTLLNVRAAASITHFIFDDSKHGSQMRWGEVLMLLRQTLPNVPAILAARSRLIRTYGKGAFPPSGPLFPMRDQLNLVFTSRQLHPDIPLIDNTFRFVGPSFDPQTRDADFPFEALGQKPVIYISLGTVHHAQRDFYLACFAAFGEYPAQFILAGKHADIATLGPVPSNFIVRPSVPQIAVLQRVDAFITHGGMNSIHEGLYYAVPLVLIPQQFEQLLNARCVAAQGAGLVLEDQLKHRQVTGAALRQSLERILSEPGYKEGASKVQKTLLATGGYRQAADEIQAYIARDRGE